jgi:hypothetical protein
MGYTDPPPGAGLPAPHAAVVGLGITHLPEIFHVFKSHGCSVALGLPLKERAAAKQGPYSRTA